MLCYQPKKSAFVQNYLTRDKTIHDKHSFATNLTRECDDVRGASGA